MILADTLPDGTRTLSFHPPNGPDRVVSRSSDGILTCNRLCMDPTPEGPRINVTPEDPPLTVEVFDRWWTTLSETP